MLVLKTILIFITLFADSFENDQSLITTPLGKIKGYYKRSYGNRTFAAFEGIPYAKPPIGELRFAEPQDPEPWSGIWDATTVYTCMQLSWMTKVPEGDEDCLYLNVYVPKDKLNENENMDVLIHFHGGAFMGGNPSSFDPFYLMDRELIYVSINYRLGPMGFLSTQDNVVSGNNGLKDQVKALQWIQNNIKHFGGNPQSVTITGVSAGGASTHFHYFSPLSKGLFHRGIVQSGTAIAPWAIQDAPLETARRLAASVGCTDSSTNYFIKCMRQRSAKQIIENVKQFNAYSGFPIAPFAPVIEKSSETAFLTEYPYKMLDNGYVNDVPLFQTVCTEEGILGYMFINSTMDELNEHWNEYLPYVLDYNYTVDAKDKSAVAQKVKEFYLHNQPVTQENRQILIKFFGDRYFMFDFEQSSRLHARRSKSPVFSYVYGYRADSNWGSLIGLPADLGVGHGEDGQLIYKVTFGGMSTNTDKLTESDEAIKELLLDFFTSFAKNGVPTSKNVTWNAVKNSEDFNCLFIHKPDDIKMISKKEFTPTEFWKSLPIKEYEKFQ